VPSEARHLAGDRVLVGAQDFPHLLGIKIRGQRRRADQVGEQDGQLPTFGLERGASRDSRLAFAARFGVLGWATQFRDGLQDPLAVAERQAELLEVLLGELRQHVEADSLAREELGMDAETDRLQPCAELVHRERPAALGLRS
jgi:hypothetical protein